MLMFVLTWYLPEVHTLLTVKTLSTYFKFLNPICLNHKTTVSSNFTSSSFFMCISIEVKGVFCWDSTHSSWCVLHLSSPRLHRLGAEKSKVELQEEQPFRK